MDRTRRTLLIGVAAVGLPSSVGSTTPNSFGEIELVTPTPPGTQPDQVARWLAQPLESASGARVVVRNRPGGSGAIAVDAVLASASPGALPLLVGGLDHVAYSHVNNDRRPLDPLSDLVPVGVVNRDSWVLVVAPGVGMDLRGLVDAAGARHLNYASNGEGSTSHLLAAGLAKALGMDAQHVPYKDSLLPDLIAGRIQFALAPVPAMLGPIRERKVVALAVLNGSRLPTLPEVPSIHELGWPALVFKGGLFLFAPPRFGREAPTINGWLVAALRDPAIVERYQQAGIETTPYDLAQTREAVTQRLQRVDAMRAALFGRAR